ncbi:MAG: hypothetical protein PGN29_17790 [Gordonia paraffinivorans]
MRRVTAVLPLAAAVLALAGCSSSDDTTDAAQSSASATTSTRTSVTASSAPTATAADEPTADDPDRQPLTPVVPPVTATATLTAEPAPAGDVDCSLATPQALLQAVHPTEIYSRMAKPVAFEAIRCAGPFATGRSAPPETQTARVLFRYEGGRWVALDLGSAIDYQRWGATPEQASRLAG